MVVSCCLFFACLDFGVGVGGVVAGVRQGLAVSVLTEGLMSLPGIGRGWLSLS